MPQWSSVLFTVLIQSEAAMMQGIIPEKHLRKIFDLLIQAAFDSLTKEGEVGGADVSSDTE